MDSEFDFDMLTRVSKKKAAKVRPRDAGAEDVAEAKKRSRNN